MVFKVLDRPNKGAEQFKCTAAPRCRLLPGDAAPESLRQYKKVLRVNGPHCVRKPVAADIKKRLWRERRKRKKSDRESSS